MNVIVAYLETMFSAYPRTPRMLEAKAELQSMMEDAYTSLIAEGRSENEAVGQVIRDFGNLEEVAPVLGITSEIQPAGSADTAQPSPAPTLPPITLDEAQGYAEVQQRIRYRISSAVVLFVLSPVALILLTTASETGLIALTSDASAAIGIMALLVMVTTGVLLITSTSREMSPYKRIAEARFTPDPTVSRWADALAQEHEGARIRALQISIAFWILSPAPIILLSLLLGSSPLQQFWSSLGVALVLLFVAIGLAILLPATWANSVAERIGNGSGSADGTSSEEHSIVGVIAAFYWPLLTLIFLAWSFIGNAWGISWIVWPIGALLFGAIAAGSGAWEGYRKAQKRSR